MKSKNLKLTVIPDRRIIFAVFGAVLILVSFSLIYQSLINAKARETAFIAIKDLPLGTVISQEELLEVAVDLSQVQEIYPSDISLLVGRTVIRNIYENELISNSMLGEGRNLRIVALKLEAGSVPPDIETNDTIDLWWINPETLQPENLISSLNTVAVLNEGSGYSSTITVVVAVEPSRVGGLISALKAESIEVVKHEN